MQDLFDRDFSFEPPVAQPSSRRPGSDFFSIENSNHNDDPFGRRILQACGRQQSIERGQLLLFWSE
jgi:hypothetical protein